MARVAIRWTVGDVSDHGFKALGLSIRGAWQIFGDNARYAVCVNSLPLAAARARTGAIPTRVEWRRGDGELPSFLRRHLDAGVAEGVAWKFAPLRLYSDCHEIALDNDCILWSLPTAMRRWLEDDSGRCLLAEDVAPAFGRFASLCGDAPRNTGIRGLPPGFDLEAALSRMLDENPGTLVSELDEQGLQVAALSRPTPAYAVAIDEVSICSPFPPHLPWLGSCGAHFTGLNMKQPRPYYDGVALERIAAHWDAQRGEILSRLAAARGESRFSMTH